MKRRWISVAVLVPLVTLVACGETGEQQEAESGQAETMAGAADTMPEAAAGTTVELGTKNASGVTGTARIEAAGDSLSVTVELTGLEEGNRYPAHLHQGSCSAGGPVAAALSSLTGEAGGAGSSTAHVSRGSLSPGETYFVQVHLPDGTPAACGDVPPEMTGEGSA